MAGNAHRQNSKSSFASDDSRAQTTIAIIGLLGANLSKFQVTLFEIYSNGILAHNNAY